MVLGKVPNTIPRKHTCTEVEVENCNLMHQGKLHGKLVVSIFSLKDS